MKAFADPSFPGLSVALNLEAMTELLQRALKDSQLEPRIAGSKIIDVKYEPGEQAIILYRFRIKDRATRITHKLLFTAALLKSDEPFPAIPQWSALTRFPESSAPLLPVPALLFERERILLCVFPYDPSIPWLADSLDEKFMKDQLNRIYIARRWSVLDAKVEMLGYTPRLRAVLIYRVLIQKDGKAEWQDLIAKTSSYKIPEALFADSWALWKECASSAGLPRPEGFLSYPHLTLQERVPGERLGNLTRSPRFQEMILQTARSIAAVHRAKIPLHKTRDPVRETQSLRRWTAVLENLRPDLAGRIKKLGSALLRQIESRTCMQGPVHGDFHPTNVLVNENKVTLIDFDQMAWGDPSADIGRFLASFRISSLRAFGSLSHLGEIKEAFLQEYCRVHSARISDIRMFEASSVITTAASAFRTQREGWEQEVLLLFEEAEKIFETAGQQERVTVTSKEPSLDVEEKLRWSRDPVYMQAVLGLCLRREYGAEVLSCELIEEKNTRTEFRSIYSLRYRVKGSEKESRLEALLPRASGRRKKYNRMVKQYDECMKNPEAISPPRPIAYLSPISTIVLELPAAVPSEP